MIIIKKENTNKFKTALEYMNELITETELELTKQGLEMKEMDPANVAALKIIIKNSLFETKELSEGNKIRLNLNELIRIIKRCKESIQLIIGDKFIVKSGNKSFELPSMIGETNSKYRDVNIEFPTKVSVNYDRFKEIIEDLKSISCESTIIKVKDNILSINSEGSKFQKYDTNEEVKETNDCASKFSVDYLEKVFSKPMFNECNISLGNDLPLELTSENNDFIIKYLLAPRIDNQ
jgi:proliferating cell nuclear antigen